MDLAAIKVTVYFAGLIAFYQPTPTTAGREVIVPLATALHQQHDMVELEPHVARVVIKGLAGVPKTVCETTLNGTFDGKFCTIQGIEGKTITLPVSTTSFTTMSPLPKVTGLCPDAELDKTFLNDASKYAARLTLASGKLFSCTNAGAWVSKLILDEATDDFSISGSTGVKLQDNAAVWIINAPSVSSGPHNEAAHFYWYYKMYSPPSGICRGLPNTPTLGLVCTVKIPEELHGAVSGGVGCSNTDYP